MEAAHIGVHIGANFSTSVRVYWGVVSRKWEITPSLSRKCLGNFFFIIIIIMRVGRKYRISGIKCVCLKNARLRALPACAIFWRALILHFSNYVY